MAADCSVPAGFTAVECKEFRGIVRSDFKEEFDRLAAAVALRQFPYTRLIKDRPKIAAGIAGDSFLKYYKPRGWFYALRHRFLLPRPLISLAGALCLKANNIPTPEVRAAIIYQKYGLPDGALLITDSLTEEDLQCDHLVEEFAGAGNYSAVVSGFADLLCRMHACGFRHGDLNLRNLYCRRGENSFNHWGVIDLDACSVSEKPLSEKPRTLDLARLIAGIRLCAGGKQIAMPESMTADFVQKYHEFSGIDLSGSFLEKRIAYHVERIRRNH